MQIDNIVVDAAESLKPHLAGALDKQLDKDFWLILILHHVMDLFALMRWQFNFELKP